MQKIVCAGMVRSGSTILYNIARLLYEEKYGAKNVYACWIKGYRRGDPREIHVVKTHQFDNKFIKDGAKVLTSRRDMRDVAASLMRKGWIKPRVNIVASIAKALSRYSAWYKHSIYDMKYEDMKTDLVRIINDVAAALELDFSNEEVAKIKKKLESLTYMSDGKRNNVYNEKNLYHKHHVTDGEVGGYKKNLTKDMITQIEKKYPEWLATKKVGDAAKRVVLIVPESKTEISPLVYPPLGLLYVAAL